MIKPRFVLEGDDVDLVENGLRRYGAELAMQWRNAENPSDLLSEEMDRVEDLLCAMALRRWDDAPVED